ncbi:signal peptidase I [Sphingobium boeckii]|uniref:Signal peptidase I n=1 Tax=Sphingobium boeckii TaxID=1082345 RepID=A0A7W9ECM0_9SPHN|nr:signal peptidase I [Sphingobium boeckii]MBB5684197.1 signal peptidase I [Sphingobium boeckii]
MSDSLNEATPADAEPVTVDSKKAGQTDWWGEVRGIFWLILAVLGFHSFIAKPFYIPSESMMPGLLTGDRLVVSKYPYGWSWVSPSFHILPFIQGRALGHLPERGDVVIAVPPGEREDYIKRAIGLPGDRLEVRGGIVILNNVPVKRSAGFAVRIPVDVNSPCNDYPGALRSGPDGKDYCELPAYRETLPNGRSYTVLDTGWSSGDDYAAITVPENTVFLMGDNRDHSADSRYSLESQGLGGPVPWENIGGRAEFITFSLDGTANWWNPISWFTAMRSGRAWTSLHPDRTTAGDQ